jgi:hypothetical protein
MNQTIDQVAENWYARLNNLKYKYTHGKLSPKKREQCLKLISIMMGRLFKVMPLYIELHGKRSMPKRFASGGVILK